ncbi:hypothetical protein CYMTET_12286 [Cymbomonas tetramitiformis]|uniref:Uncharacterized protein n=1 Tax=Cymbomonas tetramitiformis TaxID=36881 RepID=A0AAE0GKQ3_9CHLO|nr:hypothetical protein CYMTET_12286 [Cymbomonas tetramitiformis]
MAAAAQKPACPGEGPLLALEKARKQKGSYRNRRLQGGCGVALCGLYMGVDSATYRAAGSRGCERTLRDQMFLGMRPWRSSALPDRWLAPNKHRWPGGGGEGGEGGEGDPSRKALRDESLAGGKLNSHDSQTLA